MTRGASGEETNAPRCCETLNARPSSACAAVAPRQTNHPRPGQRDLGLEPRPAGGNLRAVRLGVDAPFAARLPLEVFHNIGEIHTGAVDPGLVERAIEQLPGRTDERVAGDVFGVAGLLTNHHHRRSGGPSPNTVCVARL